QARTPSSIATWATCMTASGCARKSWRPGGHCANATATATSRESTKAPSWPRLPDHGDHRHAKRMQPCLSCADPCLTACSVAGARHLEDLRDGPPRRNASNRLADQRAQLPNALPLKLRHPRSENSSLPLPEIHWHRTVESVWLTAESHLNSVQADLVILSR